MASGIFFNMEFERLWSFEEVNDSNSQNTPPMSTDNWSHPKRGLESLFPKGVLLRRFKYISMLWYLPVKNFWGKKVLGVIEAISQGGSQTCSRILGEHPWKNCWENPRSGVALETLPFCQQVWVEENPNVGPNPLKEPSLYHRLFVV